MDRFEGFARRIPEARRRVVAALESRGLERPGFTCKEWTRWVDAFADALDDAGRARWRAALRRLFAPSTQALIDAGSQETFNRMRMLAALDPSSAGAIAWQWLEVTGEAGWAKGEFWAPNAMLEFASRYSARQRDIPAMVQRLLLWTPFGKYTGSGEYMAKDGLGDVWQRATGDLPASERRALLLGLIGALAAGDGSSQSSPTTAPAIPDLRTPSEWRSWSGRGLHVSNNPVLKDGLRVLQENLPIADRLWEERRIEEWAAVMVGTMNLAGLQKGAHLTWIAAVLFEIDCLPRLESIPDPERQLKNMPFALIQRMADICAVRSPPATHLRLLNLQEKAATAQEHKDRINSEIARTLVRTGRKPEARERLSRIRERWTGREELLRILVEMDFIDSQQRLATLYKWNWDSGLMKVRDEMGQRLGKLPPGERRFDPEFAVERFLGEWLQAVWNQLGRKCTQLHAEIFRPRILRHPLLPERRDSFRILAARNRRRLPGLVFGNCQATRCERHPGGS